MTPLIWFDPLYRIRSHLGLPGESLWRLKREVPDFFFGHSCIREFRPQVDGVYEHLPNRCVFGLRELMKSADFAWRLEKPGATEERQGTA
jgi:hypothetical protein